MEGKEMISVLHRTTYENFALQSGHLFPLSNRTNSRVGLFETGTRGTRTLFPFPGDLEFPP